MKKQPKFEKEVWRPVKDHEETYVVSSLGIIKNKNTGLILRQTLNYKKGKYWGVCLYNKKEKKYNTHPVHRIVANAFIRKPKYATQINHKNRNGLNNHATNLEWVSCRENITHGSRHNPFMGAHFYERLNAYAATIMCNRKNIIVGYFKSKEEAHIIYIMLSLFYNKRDKYLAY